MIGHRAIKILASAAAGIALSCISAEATVINFDDLGDGVEVNTQYTGVTFSADAGRVILTSAQAGFATSSPNFICTAPSGGTIDCTGDVFVTFAVPVSGFSFAMTGDNDLGIIARADVYNGATLLGGVDITGDGDFYNSQLIDLSAFGNITSLQISQVTDGGGLAYDDFAFASDSTPGVPEPITLSVFGAGLAGLGAMRRKAKKA